ncbi:MAG TPA: TlpA disulfide reductase family protein [Prolixibacteraceae bacterium]|jgi:thiol-disulfide isomerase/thioredoxin
MKTMIKVSIFFFLIFSLNQSFAQQDTTLVKLFDPVPAFDYELSPGIRQNIADLKGKLVLVTFFATWCGPCRQELPHIQSEIYNKYKDNPKFKLLIFGREHNWKEVNKFKEANKYTMPFYPDPDRKIYAQFAKQFIPRNFLISPDGKVIFSSIGFVQANFDALKELIKTELKSK